MKRVWFLLLGLLGATACTTTPVERQENVTSELTDVKTEMVEARTQIDKTLTSLNALLTASPDNLRSAYNQYAADVEALKDKSEDVEKNSQQFQEQRNKWLAQWQASQSEVQSSELKEVSRERRTELATRFRNIDSSFAAARDAYTPLVENLDDVRVVVGSDLTPNGIAAVANTGVVQNAFSYGSRVDENLEAAITEFDELSEVLSPKAGR